MRKRLAQKMISLRPSAYLCGLCVEMAIKRRERRVTQRAAEKMIWASVMALMVLMSVHAQQPAASPTPTNGNGDTLGDYAVISRV